MTNTNDRLTRIRAGGAIGVADAEWLLGEFDKLAADAAGVQAELASVKLENKRLDGHGDRMFDEIKRLRAAFGRSRELLRRCVTEGYSRHELNVFLAADENALDGPAHEPDAIQPGDGRHDCPTCTCSPLAPRAPAKSAPVIVQGADFVLPVKPGASHE